MMKYQVIIKSTDFEKRISFKNVIRAKAEYIWWEKAAEERGFKLTSIKVIDKETNSVIFEKNY